VVGAGLIDSLSEKVFRPKKLWQMLPDERGLASISSGIKLSQKKWLL
jgi:hypothetical protein